MLIAKKAQGSKVPPTTTRDGDKPGPQRSSLYVDLPPDDAIRTIAVNHCQIAGDAVGRKARDGALPILRRRFGHFQHLEVTVTQDGDFALDCPTGGMAQPVIWLINSIQYLLPAEDLYCGYIRGDDVWHEKGWLLHAFDSIRAITGRTGKLVMPLEWVSKAEVIYRLKMARIYKHTWYCEDLDNRKKPKPCGVCDSCCTHRTALWRLEQRIEAFDKYHEQAKAEVESDERTATARVGS